MADCIPIIKRSSLLYQSSVFGENVTVLHRLVDELKMKSFTNLLKVYLSKWEYFRGYPAFNYCLYKIKIDTSYAGDVNDILFENCQYKLLRNYDVDDKNPNNNIIMNFNQEMVIKNNYSSIANSYTIFVHNNALFGSDDWIMLQQIENIDFTTYTNAFCANLELIDNQVVSLKQDHDSKCGDGEYDVVSKESKHRIYAKSDFPTIRTKISLSFDYWYFEVHIIKKEARNNVWIGFANSNFKANEKKNIGVGCDINSWSSNGSIPLHNNSKEKTWRREWTEGDVIGCCIDLKGNLDDKDRKFIAYYLNGRLLNDVKFTKLRNCFGVYPCISLDKGTIIDIVFDKLRFKHAIPDNFKHITFNSKPIFHHNIPQKYHDDVAKARYLTKVDEKELNINPKSDFVDKAHMYHKLQLNELNFVVPFCKTSSHFSVYVQPNEDSEFTLMKTFDIAENESKEAIYLLKTLMIYNSRIKDSKRFYGRIGFEVTEKWIPRIKTSKLAYQPSAISKKTTVMRRIAEELGFKQLLDLCAVYDIKFEMIAMHKAFNYSTFKMRTDHILSPVLSSCEYRMFIRKNFDESDYKSSVELSHKDEIMIINGKQYVAEIKNQSLFGFNTFMELQTIYTKTQGFGRSDDEYIADTEPKSDEVQNNDKIILEQEPLFNIHYGDFDLDRTESGYRVSNINNYALLCANKRLNTGKYYYEVHINDIELMTRFRVGWATKAFLSINNDEKECGDSVHSFGWNGRNLLHGRLENMKAYRPNNDYGFRPRTVIGCCIDIDAGQIKYYVNNLDLDVAFDNIQFQNQELFPCISYAEMVKTEQIKTAILDFEIVCNQKSFKCDAVPTGYNPIHAEDSPKMHKSSNTESTVVKTEKNLKKKWRNYNPNIYQFSNAFVNSLEVQNNKKIILEQGPLSSIDYGDFDLDLTESGHHVSNIKNYALLCANTRLNTGKYYYEVHINSSEMPLVTNLRIGWANKPFLTFKSSYKLDLKQCGDSEHSYGWNGRTLYHHRLEDAKQYGSTNHYFRAQTFIGCCIDIDKGQIKYYSNNVDFDIAFDNIQFQNPSLFPCVSWKALNLGLDFEIVCNPQSFKCDAIPTDYNPIDCDDVNHLFTHPQKIHKMYHSEILNSKYTMYHTEKNLKNQLRNHHRNIYQFDDMSSIQFIIPLNPNPINIGIYVQPKEGFNFKLIRSFRIKPTHKFKTDDQCSNEVEYLLKALNDWNYKITDSSKFFERVGVNLSSQHMNALTKQAECLQFPSVTLDTALTKRLVNELDVKCLSNYLKVLLSTFNASGYAFNFCAIKINPNQAFGDNDGSELQWFERYQYKLTTDETKEEDVMFAYNEQIHIKDGTRYKIYLMSKSDDKSNESMHIQTIEPTAICSASFIDNFVLADNKVIFTVNAHNLSKKYHDEILNASYLMVYKDTINPKEIMNESDGTIYKFNNINDIRFILPFNTKSEYVHLYVKPQKNFNFVLIKRLKVQKREDVNQIDYLLNVLKAYDVNITDEKQFYEYVGVSIESTDIAHIQKSKELYASTASGPDVTCLHRLVQELKVKQLSDMLLVFDSKLHCVGNFKTFNYSIFRIALSSDSKYTKLFADNEYKLISYYHAEDEKETVFQYNDEVIICNNTFLHQSYTIYISNPTLFGINDYIELQHIDSVALHQFSNDFYNALTVFDDKIIGIAHDNALVNNTYGEYSVLEKETGYKITANSLQATISANCTLTDGTYCFEVQIVERHNDNEIYVGFAEEGFVPQNKNDLGASVGRSWAISGANRHIHWNVNDVICCCVDIQSRVISYFVNGKAIKRNFESINVDKALLFPVITLHQSDIVEVRFNANLFKYPAPTGYNHIDFKDYNVFLSQAQEILNTKYTLLWNESRTEIKAQEVYDNEHYIYPLDDAQNIQFIIPFNRDITTISIYIQLKDNLDFVSFKTFPVKQDKSHPHAQILYLLDILMAYDAKIKSANHFWKQIGFNANEWNKEQISIMKKEFHHILYKPTLLNRLHRELHMLPFNDIFTVLSSKFKYTNYSLFDYCAYKIDLDKDANHSSFAHCVYKLIGVQNEEMEEKKENEMIYKYNEEITLTYNTALYPLYKIMVQSKDLFEMDQFFELQRFKAPALDKSGKDFKRLLHVDDTNKNKFITLKFEDGDYGEYDEYHHIGYYRITSKSAFPTIRANCEFTKGIWYYKVKIVETVENGWILIGFAATDFKPSPTLCVGDDANGWAFSGLQLWHNGRQISADYGSRPFQKGDVITCALNIEKKQISYQLNENVLGIAFDDVDLITVSSRIAFFPCVSMQNKQTIDISFAPQIEFKDKTNIFVRPFKLGVITQILNSKYTVICDTKYTQIKQLKDSDNVYEFDALSDMQFLIPMTPNKKTGTVSLFVQNRKESDFVLFKTFEARFKTFDESDQLKYLYNALLGYKNKINGVTAFSNKIGFDVKSRIEVLKRKQEYDLFAFCDGYNSSKRILDRLYEEFDDKHFVAHRKLLLSKFQYIHTSKAFGYCVHKLQVYSEDNDSDGDLSSGIYSKYKLESIRNHGMESGSKVSVFIKTNEPLISRSGDISHLYVIYIQNKDVFKTDKYIEIQRFNKPDFSECSDAFVHHLQMTNKTIQLSEPQGDYGKYHVDHNHYDEILQSKYFLGCTNSHLVAYEFSKMDELRFIIPFRAHLNKWSQLKLYVQSPLDHEMVLLKTFDTHHFKTSAYNSVHSQLRYLLDLLTIYDQKVIDTKDFFHKIGHEDDGKDFEWNNKWSVMLKTPEYDSILKQMTPLNVDVRHRLIHELHLEINIAFKTFQCIYTSKAFSYCLYKLKDNNSNDDDEKLDYLDISKGCKYKVESITNHGMKSEYKNNTFLQFEDDHEMIINICDKPDIYVIYIQNKEVFNSDEYVEIQRFNKPDFSECSDAFVHNLQMKNKMIQLINALDHNQHDEILQSKYILSCGSSQDSAVNVEIVYEFSKMNDLQFIVPFRMHLSHWSELKLYVQSPQHRELVLLKTFNTDHLKTSIYSNNSVHSLLQYLLDLLTIYDQQITDTKDFFHKIGHEDEKDFEWNNKCKVALRIPKYDSILKQMTPLNVDVRHRLVNELRLEMNIASGMFQCICTSKAFGFCLYRLQIYNQNNDDDDEITDISEGSQYEVDCIANSNMEYVHQNFTSKSLNYKDDLIININDKPDLYVIYIKNKDLFQSNDSVEIQRFKPDFSESSNAFVHNLQMKDNMIQLTKPQDSANELDKKYYDEILQSKYILSCGSSQYVTTKVEIVYEFSKMDELRFILPFRAHLSNWPNLKLCVQSPLDPKMVLLKTFDTRHLRTSAYNSAHSLLRYLLDLLMIYDHQITDTKDFFRKIGHEDEKDFEWNNKWNVMLRTPEYDSTLKQMTPLNVDVRHRLIHELHLETTVMQVMCTTYNENPKESVNIFGDIYSANRFKHSYKRDTNLSQDIYPSILSEWRYFVSNQYSGNEQAFLDDVLQAINSFCKIDETVWYLILSFCEIIPFKDINTHSNILQTLYSTSEAHESCEQSYEVLDGSRTKWYASSTDDVENTSPMLLFEFCVPVNVIEYQIKSADDCPHRDPYHWYLFGCFGDELNADNKIIVLHEYNGHKEERKVWNNNGRWKWEIFTVKDYVDECLRFKFIGLAINKGRENKHDIQIGQIRFKIRL